MGKSSEWKSGCVKPAVGVGVGAVFGLFPSHISGSCYLLALFIFSKKACLHFVCIAVLLHLILLSTMFSFFLSFLEKPMNLEVGEMNQSLIKCNYIKFAPKNH